jgi:fumarylpyruvate hydrolase
MAAGCRAAARAIWRRPPIKLRIEGPAVEETRLGYVIPPTQLACLPIRDSADLFPVHRIFCVGRNYAEHARELGHDPDREPPFFFTKPADALITDGRFPYPSQSQNVHHELELVVALAKGGFEIAPERALDCIFGYAVGLDMTRRDRQEEARKMGRPWDSAKAFDHSAPCSAIAPAGLIGHPASGSLRLMVNGERRQEGDLAQMIWKVPEVIAHLSGLFTLAPGDLIFTGTPKGVGPVQRGDRLEGQIEGVGGLRVEVV